MNLHEAMELILREMERPMSAGELAAEINRRGLYVRGDGGEVPPSQISARRANYPDRFSLSDGLISLK